MKRSFPVFGVSIAMMVASIYLEAGRAQGADLANPAASPVQITLDQSSALPSGARAVVKMHQRGVDKDVVLNYIQNAPLPYSLSADGIIYLQSLGVPGDFTKAMIQRDAQLQQQATEQYNQQQQMAAALAMQKASMMASRWPAPMANSPMPASPGAWTGEDSANPYSYDYGEGLFPFSAFGWPSYNRGFGTWGLGGRNGRGGYDGFHGERGGLQGETGAFGGGEGAIGIHGEGGLQGQGGLGGSHMGGGGHH
jgi:hypothetical protein